MKYDDLVKKYPEVSEEIITDIWNNALKTLRDRYIDSLPVYDKSQYSTFQIYYKFCLITDDEE